MIETRRTLLLASITPFSLFVALGLAAEHGWLGTAQLDAPSSGIRSWAAGQPWLEHPLFLVEQVFATQGLTIATLALAASLVLMRRFRAGLLVLVVMLTVREASGWTKELFGRDRPVWQDSEFLHHAGSYPSGHAAGVATLGGLLVVLTLLGARSRAHVRPVGTAVAVVVLVVCLDRLLLGRHYPTDVIGGVLLATGLVLLGTALFAPLAGAEREGAEPVTQTEDSEAPTVEVAEEELVASADGRGATRRG